LSSQVNKALEEIAAVEKILKPYEYQVIEARESLKDLAAIRELVNNPTRQNLVQSVEKLKTVENRVNRYKGYGPAEEALHHIATLKEMAKAYGL